MTIFRPCIDLHEGKVKQIVGSTLDTPGLKTNFEAKEGAAHFAQLYKKFRLAGGHIISLGSGNEAQIKAALAAYPGGMQVGGGVTPANAMQYIAWGASHVIATSYLFNGTHFQKDCLLTLEHAVGKERLVLDLSCKKTENGYVVAKDRWQTLTDLQVTEDTLEELALHCDEFLVHAASVEGKQEGMDEELIELLAEISPIPVTYAGGARSVEDLEKCGSLSLGRVDLTIGSALDIFGGSGAKLEDCVAFNERCRI
jgi:phosphoribosylformimino-5-aminoimidazole carboxamide ribotide isomerase